MTKDEDFKALVRARMGKTGESYTTARRHILAENPSWTNAAAGDLDERVQELESKVVELIELVRELEWRVEEIEEPGWDPPNGVSRYGGEIMIRCSGCGMEARGFASEEAAAEALKAHYRERGHTGPLSRPESSRS